MLISTDVKLDSYLNCCKDRHKMFNFFSTSLQSNNSFRIRPLCLIYIPLLISRCHCLVQKVYIRKQLGELFIRIKNSLILHGL